MSKNHSTKEIWKDIPGYKGHYQASTFGRIKSLKRPTTRPDRCFPRDRILKQHKAGKNYIIGKGFKPNDGYWYVCLCKNGKPKGKMVHRLVLEAFIGPCPKGMKCRHFPDRNRKNNRLNNLQWGTNEQNYQDRITHGTSAKGEKNAGQRYSSNLFSRISFPKRIGIDVFCLSTNNFSYYKTTMEIRRRLPLGCSPLRVDGHGCIPSGCTLHLCEPGSDNNEDDFCNEISYTVRSKKASRESTWSVGSNERSNRVFLWSKRLIGNGLVPEISNRSLELGPLV